MPATTKALGNLHDLVTRELIRRIESGEATAADLAQAIKLLKDNGITAVPTDNNPLGRLVVSLKDRLPFTTEQDAMLQ
jgi:ABC-type Zn uptake system ZnuABC Zn-binding protein ZnuA